MEPAQECAVFGGAETSSPCIHSEQRTDRLAGSCRGDYSALHNSAQRGSLWVVLGHNGRIFLRPWRRNAVFLLSVAELAGTVCWWSGIRTSDPHNNVITPANLERRDVINQEETGQGSRTFKGTPNGFSSASYWRAPSAAAVCLWGGCKKWTVWFAFSIHFQPAWNKVCSVTHNLRREWVGSWRFLKITCGDIVEVSGNHHEDHRGNGGLWWRGLQHFHDLRSQQPIPAHHRARPLHGRLEGIEVGRGVPEVLLWNFKVGRSGEFLYDPRTDVMFWN